MFSSPLLPQGFLIVDESGNSRGDVHLNIAGPLFSCLGSFFSSLFSSSHHEPISYRPVVSYYPDLSSSYLPTHHHRIISACHPRTVPAHCHRIIPTRHPHIIPSCHHPVQSIHLVQASPQVYHRNRRRVEKSWIGEKSLWPSRLVLQSSSEKPTKLQKNHPTLDQA